MDNCYHHIKRKYVPAFKANSLDCFHVWSDWFPHGPNAKCLRVCFRCKKRQTKKEFFEIERERKVNLKTLIEKIKKNLHIDLWW